MSENKQQAPIAIGEIEQGPSQLDQFLDKNQKNLIIAGIALALIIAGFIIFRGMKESKLADASAALMNAENASSLQDVAQKYSGTPSGGTALLALADAQWDKNEKDASIENLKSFLNDYSDHPAYAGALVNLASKLLKNGQAEAAEQFLQQAVNLEDPTFTPMAQVLIAESNLKAGRKEEALGIYNELDSLSDEDLGSLRGLINSRSITSKAPIPPEEKP